jgi:hypothetical protein
MSWMTKGGSSSALGQSPLRFPLNELARRGVATTAYDFASAGGWDSVIDPWRRWGADRPTRSAKRCRASEGAATPPHEGVYPSEGFG